MVLGEYLRTKVLALAAHLRERAVAAVRYSKEAVASWAWLWPIYGVFYSIIRELSRFYSVWAFLIVML
jgi:hypothetical protein